MVVLIVVRGEAAKVQTKGFSIAHMCKMEAFSQQEDLSGGNQPRILTDRHYRGSFTALVVRHIDNLPADVLRISGAPRVSALAICNRSFRRALEYAMYGVLIYRTDNLTNFSDSRSAVPSVTALPVSRYCRTELSFCSTNQSLAVIAPPIKP